MVLSKSVKFIGLPSEPLLVDFCSCGFRHFSGKLLFDSEVPILVPLLVCARMIADVARYGSQAMEQCGVFGQWIGVDCLGPDLFKVVLLFSGILTVVPPADRC